MSYSADFPEVRQLSVFPIHRKDVLKDIDILAEKLIASNELVNGKVNQIKKFKALKILKINPLITTD